MIPILIVFGVIITLSIIFSKPNDNQSPPYMKKTAPHLGLQEKYKVLLDNMPFCGDWVVEKNAFGLALVCRGRMYAAIYYFSESFGSIRITLEMSVMNSPTRTLKWEVPVGYDQKKFGSIISKDVMEVMQRESENFVNNNLP